jgi:hypothetical protein
MNSLKVKEAVDHAKKVSEAYGVNIVKETIELLKEASEMIDKDDENLSTLADVWYDAGDSILRRAFLGTEGHMSSKQSVVMKAECKTLAEVLSEEFDTVEEIEKTLGG